MAVHAPDVVEAITAAGADRLTRVAGVVLEQTIVEAHVVRRDRSGHLIGLDAIARFEAARLLRLQVTLRVPDGLRNGLRAELEAALEHGDVLRETGENFLAFGKLVARAELRQQGLAGAERTGGELVVRVRRDRLDRYTGQGLCTRGDMR